MQRLRLLVLTGPLLLLGASSEAPTSHTAETESKIFTMDRIYKSMFGPKDDDVLSLPATEESETLWVTAIRADVVGADGETPESEEHFCHSVFSRLDGRAAADPIPGRQVTARPRKMFTLVQGASEVRFPAGFGMPVRSTDQFKSVVMVMNPIERAEPVRVGVDSRIEYVRESELTEPMIPLSLLTFVTRVPVEAPDADHSGHQHEGDDSCLEAEPDATVARSVDRTGLGHASPVTRGEAGIRETGHWYVPPGRHVYRHKLEKLDQLVRFDTTAHYVYAHLHPYGESLELIDLTTGESVFKALATTYPDRVAVQNITHYSSPEGIPIRRGHEYEIVAIYDNTTSEDVDSMAVMYLYVRDWSRASQSGT